MDNANWSAVKDVRDKGLFRIGAVVMADPSYSGRASACVKKYQSVLDYKWESTFKNGSVEGSKDQIKRYRYECDSISNWIRTEGDRKAPKRFTDHFLLMFSPW